MSLHCEICGNEFEAWGNLRDRCRRCHWTSDGWVQEADEHYLVFYAVVQRALALALADPPRKGNGAPAPNQPERAFSEFIKIEASSRETAVLQQGDQMRLDGVLWRVTAVLENILWLRAVVFTTNVRKNHQFITTSAPWSPPGS